MEFWREIMASSIGKEFVAGGIGGMAGVLSGHPLDTLRVRLQQPPSLSSSSPAHRTSAVRLMRSIVASEGPMALYRGMAVPLGSIAFQNAIVFQLHAVLSRVFDSHNTNEPPSYKSVALAGVGTGALQSFILSPVELVKIRLQLQTMAKAQQKSGRLGPLNMAKDLLRTEGLSGIYRGLLITVLRDAPAFGVYFSTYEFARERIHPGCRKSGEESLATMLFAGGLAGVASWVCCYPQDVLKSRLQAQSSPRLKPQALNYNGIVDCLRKSVQEEGVGVLFRGLGTAVARAFMVNGAVFCAYELALRFLVNGNKD